MEKTAGRQFNILNYGRLFFAILRIADSRKRVGFVFSFIRESQILERM